ncbi:MAG: hypothetical protein Kow0074_20320 [Candidatus Zixiibacteriota bacterium]
MRELAHIPQTPTAGILNQNERGFPPSRLANQSEPKVKKDERGYYIMTLSENLKVYFEDYYQFLELLAQKCSAELARLADERERIPNQYSETISYFRARRIILEVLLKNIRSFYTDRHNLGVIMTPWCFGTVILEKVEMVRDRIARGEYPHPDLGDYPYDVVRYIDEAHTRVLMDIFEFPPKAFSMRWQYTELIRRYSDVLSDVATTLQNILSLVKSYGQ